MKICVYHQYFAGVPFHHRREAGTSTMKYSTFFIWNRLVVKTEKVIDFSILPCQFHESTAKLIFFLNSFLYRLVVVWWCLVV